MNSRDAYIALNMIDYVGPVRVKRLLERFGQPQAILSASARELMRVDGVGEEVARAITGWQSSVDLSAELKRISDFGAQVLTLDDAAYPANLREIYDPP
ncbi:MAG: DNA-protecting protein DprA, partial [Verrucomicrobia bacterium]|nr:DNA-protecting protein DprA [Verrucomicrobiota bacterium]